MKLLFASDSFKGSLTSEKTVELLSRAAGEVFGECECSGVPVADGGEGTVEAVIAAEHGEYINVKVHGPLMEETESFYGTFDGNKAVIEMAAASGLPMVPEELRNPLNTTTFGTGELILDALKRGFRDISIAIGGSATNDGGMGCARALGVKFLDQDGNELEGFGRDLARVAAIDISGLDERVKDSKITVMCDVTNPLCGKAGTGAAGGLGAALMVFLGGEMKSGIETVLDLIRFDERLEGVDLVVTGEGRTDWQSCFGKVMQGVGMRAKAKGIPVLGLSGSLGKNAMDICSCGISSLMTTVNAPMPLSEALERAEELYYEGAIRMFRFVRTGMEI